MPDTERLKYLLTQAHELRASQEEYEELLAMINGDQAGEVIDQINAFHSGESAEGYDRVYWQAAVREILDSDRMRQPEADLIFMEKPVYRIKPWKWSIAAASVILIVTTGIWLLKPRHTNRVAPAIVATTPANADVKPGGNNAMLILGDGSEISLDSAGNGTLAQQGNTRITKSANGQLLYNNTGKPSAAATLNTLKTPLGGQYKLTLSDGTLVWLNAGSSITYPTSFSGGTRQVSVTGESYFEVAPDANTPFRVKVNNIHVEVLGTHFNINAYEDESSVKTTLLEGAVKVAAGGHERLLAPGQQARIAPGTAIQVVDNVNISESVAWKEGYFSFDNADIQTVMRQLSRWYNIEVKYEGAIPQRVFTGEIGRSLTLTQVLKGLSKTRIKYRIESGNRIVIQP